MPDEPNQRDDPPSRRWFDEDRVRGWRLLDRAPIGAIVAATDAAGPCVYLNRRFVAITGYDLDDIPTVTAWLERAYPDPEYRAYVEGRWDRDVLAAHLDTDVRYRVRTKGGEDRYIVFRAELVAPGWMLVLLRDDTAGYLAERALLASEERYRKLVDHSPDGILVHDGGRVVFVNPAGAWMFGGPSPEAFIGQEVMQFVHPDFRSLVAQRITHIIGEGRDMPAVEEKFIRRDGTEIDVEVIGGTVEVGGRTMSQVIFRDITERKRAQAERELLLQRLGQAQKLESLAVLAGGVAHDFNNLLTAVLGNVELGLMTERLDPAVEERLRDIDLITRHAADLASQMLAYAGRSRLETQRLDLSRLVSDQAELVRVSIGRRIRVAISVARDLPPLEGDATQLQQVVLNLVNNAADSLGEGEGLVRISTGRATLTAERGGGTWTPADVPPGDYLYLEVKDNGLGMDEATCARIFDPFFTTKMVGRGLGLAAVLGIVRAHRGAVFVTSEEGVGTRFRVYFPTAGTSGVLPAVAEAPSTPRSAWKGHGTVLLVEDHAQVRRITTTMLRRAGFDVEAAPNGVEALKLWSQGLPGLVCVVLDRTMPVMGGEETLRQLRARGVHVPVIMCSGFDHRELVDALAAVGPVGYLQKPFRYDDLIHALRLVLDKA